MIIRLRYCRLGRVNSIQAEFVYRVSRKTLNVPSGITGAIIITLKREKSIGEPTENGEYSLY